MRSHQSGISLPVVLALLLGMALLGAAVLQSGLLQTRMAAELHARNLAFQAAEGALRAGEEVAGSGVIPLDTGCAGGLCGTPAASAVERWRQAGSGDWQRLPDAHYLVEYMGMVPSTPDCEEMLPIPDSCLRPLYRITARSMNARTVVMLQSHYLDARVSWRELGPE